MENFYDIDFEKVGQQIKRARKSIGLSQEAAAGHAHISSQFWSSVELGRERASINTYRQIAAVLGLALNDIFYDDSEIARLHNSATRDELLSDCTLGEKEIISEVISALKVAMRKHRAL